MDDEEFIIEEVDSVDLPEGELAEFTEIKPLEVVEVVSTENETEGALITKFMCGEGELPDLHPKLEEIYDEDEEDEQQEQKIDGHSNTNLVIDEDEKPKSSKQTRGSRGKYNCLTHTRRGLLNPALKGLMGEANLCFAQNQKDKCEKICMEIIRQNPLAPEPFLTLAQIYENRDINKYIGFHTIAAHLMPQNREQWLHVVNLYKANGNMAKARVYYSKAIKVIPRCYELRLGKAQFLEEIGDKSGAMFAYLYALPLIPSDRGEFCLETAKTVTRYFYELNKHKLAMEAMNSAYKVCAKLFTLEDINLYLELLILNKKYVLVVQCLVECIYLNIECEPAGDLENIICCVIPEDYVPDIRSKLIVALINLRAYHLIDYLISNVHEHLHLEMASNLDLYVDIAEALMQQQKYAEAITLLSPLTEGHILSECPAFIWLRYAECFRHINRIDEAIDSYYRVVELAPNCYEAKFTLSAILKQQGKHEEAVNALTQSNDADEPLNARMLYERCLMLQEVQRVPEFLKVGYDLLSRHSLELRSRDEIMVVAQLGNFFYSEGIKTILEMRNISENNEQTIQHLSKPAAADSDLSLQDEYDLFINLISTAFEQQNFSYIERLCFAMITTKRFVNYNQNLLFTMILACYYNKDGEVAFLYLRDFMVRQTQNMSLWNILSLFGKSALTFRYQRFIRRLVKRHQCIKQAHLFLAHDHLYCSSYKYALLYYLPIFKEGKDALAALCIAVVFNQLSLQKKVLRKSAAVGQAVAFAQAYAEMRCGSQNWQDENKVLPVHQEIYYNMGRIYQQAGMNHLAVHYYELALAVEHPLLTKYEEYIGLKQETAFNLHLIYRASGNLRKARHYLYTYCII